MRKRNIEFVRSAGKKYENKSEARISDFISMLHLSEKYKKEVIPEMMKRFGYKNPMAVPKIEKVVVNCCFGREISGKGSSDREKIIKNVSNILSMITGQKPALAPARKSIAAFKLREGMPIGLKATLRKKRMYDFLERLIWLVLPRTRDFRGIPLETIDKQGNLTIGFKDYSPFLEVVIDRDKGVFGLEATVVTTARDKKEGIELLRLLGFPLKAE